jgi:hypothetical protein
MPRRLTAEDIAAAAARRGGVCLNPEAYRNTQTRLRWQCEEGHEWETTTACVRSGSWCRQCAIETGRVGRPRTATLERAIAAAAERGGLCLSPEGAVTRCTDRLDWECEAGHAWDATFTSVVHRGSWCPTCAGKGRGGGRRPAVEFARAVDAALDRGGLCLSPEAALTRSTDRLDWECEAGHVWDATFTSVVHLGTWCRECATYGRAGEVDIEEALAAADRRGGLCLSEEVTRGADRLTWECSPQTGGHSWEATYASVVGGGTWCPRCHAAGRWKSEEDVRLAFEAATGHAAPNRRPRFLGGLELDGYCPELGVAFEYHGRQHYEYVPFFHRNGPADLAAQQERDRRTAAGCDAEGVALIEIPHWVADPVEELRKELELLGLA